MGDCDVMMIEGFVSEKRCKEVMMTLLRVTYHFWGRNDTRTNFGMIFNWSYYTSYLRS